MIGNVIQSKFLEHPRLPDGGGAVVHPDGVHPRRHLHLRPGARRAQPDRGGDLSVESHAARPRSRRAGRSADCWSGRLALLYLFIPVFIVVLFSFNDNKGRFNFTWQGFTLATGRTRSPTRTSPTALQELAARSR